MTTITHTPDGPRFDGMTVGELIASLEKEATILETANEEGGPYIRSIIAALRHMSEQRANAEAIVEGIIASVCSDGNSDARAVARQVVAALRPLPPGPMEATP